MKKLIFTGSLMLILAGAAFSEGKTDEGSAASVDNDTSYAFGMMIGSDLKDLGLTFNYTAFMKGMREVLEDKDTNLTMDEAADRVGTVYRETMAKQAQEAQAKEQVFLKANAQKPGIQTTESGLQYEVLTEGYGEKPKAEDTVLAHYQGTFTDGTIFDSSYDRGEPMEFPLYAVIPGWSEGVQLMSVGSKYRLYVPSDLAYGAQGGGNVIPPYATLIFEVELLSILQGEDEADTETEYWQ